MKSLIGYSLRVHTLESHAFSTLETSTIVSPVRRLQKRYTPGSLSLGAMAQTLSASQSKICPNAHITYDLLRCVLLRRNYVCEDDLKEAELVLKLLSNALQY